MRIHGIKVPHLKNTADRAPERIELPPLITLPMSMHIGTPARPAVKAGEHVKVGQLIGEADGFVSAPVHTGVSGKVKKIDEITAFNGRKIPAVLIETDGAQEIYEGVAPPNVRDFDSFIAAVKTGGAVGLGGAGFPTYVKLNVKDTDKIKEVVINAAECEPYITSDTRTMLDKTDELFLGIDALRRFLGVKRFIIAVENNKKEAISKIRSRVSLESEIELCVLPSIYPQGGEKVIVYNTTGKIIPADRLPIDIGVIVINVTTLAFIGEYLKTGMPLMEKCVTIDGGAVNEPKNVIVPIGTHVSHLLEAAGGLKEPPKKILYGGPMMGLTVPTAEHPVLKNTNAVIALSSREAVVPKTTACIGCGACMSHCPFRLNPRAISRAYSLKRYDELLSLCVTSCMECGCCSYVCPAKRLLVQTNKLAKALLRAQAEKSKEAL